MLLRFFRKSKDLVECCFYVEVSAPLVSHELSILQWLLAETFEPEHLGDRTFFVSGNGEVVEVGPRLNFETAFSTNAVAICRSCGLTEVTRLERSRRFFVPLGVEKADFVAKNHDRMTECVYSASLESFETGLVPEPVCIVPVLEEGIGALCEINQELGLGMDGWDLKFYYDLFAKKLRRNLTNVECFQLAQMNSEHSRHWFFKGKMVVDGETKPETLLEIIMSTLRANPSNSVIAFSDNSSGIKGFPIVTIIPQDPGNCSAFGFALLNYNIICTAETHNFPSGVAPFPGAETGTGGRIRDIQATGRGGLMLAGTAGYCVGNLLIPDYKVPAEDSAFIYPGNLARPLKILIEESNGASDYGNKIGEPVIAGFCRTLGLRLPSGERREWLKPIMFTGGIGQIYHLHVEKGQPQTGMLVVQIGGPAYRIGVGGGAASSMIQGQNIEALDFNAVQRGDAEMEQKMNRVIRACVEMGVDNPIISIHDQGAGGPCNVLTELVSPAGGRIEIRNITLGDKTLSVLEIWGAEFQERNAVLIRSERLEEFRAICVREKVACEVLGEITGDGKIVVYDSKDNSHPVDLDLGEILTNVPQKTFQLETIPQELTPLSLPENLTVAEALRLVFRLPSVGSKGFLVRKVDRSVTGLIARQQCCGPLQLPVADVAVVAQSHFGLTGAATAIGEQPIKGLISAGAGARMAVGEALTNLVWARISDLSHVKCSVNWMLAGKLPGEGAWLYRAARALRDLMIRLGIAADGGKDSLSMAAKVGEEIVKAPGQVVVSAYCTVPDITKVITPDIKAPGQSKLLYLNLGLNMAPRHYRLGGTALAQAFGQIGDETADVEDPGLLEQGFLAIQQMIDKNLILSGHDVSDGGLITTLCEMALSGNCGLRIDIPSFEDPIPFLFQEELGLVVECLPEQEMRISAILDNRCIPYAVIGVSLSEDKILVTHRGTTLMKEQTRTVLDWWEATSDQLERHQMNPELAKKQSWVHHCGAPKYSLSFSPEATPFNFLTAAYKPRVAILREEGSNGDREMTSAFFAAGFEPWDVTMTDLLLGRATLDQFRGAVFVGGFSYADVLDSAKGWAGIIRFNPKLAEMFDAFYRRPDTFSLGICNGCQLMALLGWVPWKGIPDVDQPRFIRNPSQRFESRWVAVRINESPAIMLDGMSGSVLGIWVAHGEGQFHAPQNLTSEILQRNLVPLQYLDEEGRPTSGYPANPNGSPEGIAGLCTPDGRHLAIMPHPERAFLKWQWPWMPESWRTNLKAGPWLRLFQNAHEWCLKNR
jgi:phosphoribosylformylglycinamidine synthase